MCSLDLFTLFRWRVNTEIISKIKFQKHIKERNLNLCGFWSILIYQTCQLCPRNSVTSWLVTQDAYYFSCLLGSPVHKSWYQRVKNKTFLWDESSNHQLRWYFWEIHSCYFPNLLLLYSISICFSVGLFYSEMQLNLPLYFLYKRIQLVLLNELFFGPLIMIIRVIWILASET